VAGPISERTGRLDSAGLCAAARTERGPVRPQNEDSYVCRPDLGLFAVIDGMGGHQAGERAAAIVHDELLARADVVGALAAANEKVHGLATSEKTLAGMGCVASALRLKENKAQIAHVGDTRIYLASAAGCEQLTRDHTVAATRQEELGLSERRARGLGGHNQVTRDIGGRRRTDSAWIDELSVSLEADDLVLMCSDGLHGSIPRAELVERLRTAARTGAVPEAFADELVDRALDLGTRDNVTVVVLRRVPTGP
jgi:serine/threonine protein phosphatase PrpC